MSDINELKKIVDNHDLQLGIVTESLNKISEQISVTNEVLIKQERILEKVANVKEQSNDLAAKIKELSDRVNDIQSSIVTHKSDVLEYVNNKDCPWREAVEEKIKTQIERIRKLEKIVWWAGTGIIGLVVFSIIKQHLV